MPPQILQVGQPAPEFTLSCTPRGPQEDRQTRLSDYRGKWLILIFYPRDFSLVCPTELTALSARNEEFQKRGCELLGVSTDSIATHEQWIAAPRGQGGLGGLSFPLAADEDGAAARAYGIYLEWQRMALRGLFIIDPNGILQYAVVHNTSVGRRSDEVLRVVDAVQSGGLCPENWTPGSKPIEASQSIKPGSILAHYRFGERLGSGSFATVFKAHDLQLQRTVAIKVIQPSKVPSPAAVLAEARAAAALQHPNICTVFSVDDSEGVPLIVMEYIAGKSLAETLKAGPVSSRRGLSIGRQIAQGMAAAHAAGIVHGDLKPENILLSENGTAKITDFGLARRDPLFGATAETMTWDNNTASEAGVLSGTPAYMAPEQLEGHGATAASDVFALGLILYETATGRRVFSGESLMEVFSQIRTIDPDRLSREVPAPLSEVLRQALRIDPSQRPAMKQLIEWLPE